MNACIETSEPIAVTRLPTWSERNQQWLVAAIARLRARIEAQIPASPNEVPDSVAADATPGFTPALLHCAQIFGLTAFERELLLLVAGLDLDQGLRAAVASLNAGASSRASYTLALGILTEPHWDALSPDAALRHWLIVEPEPGASLLQAALHLDERVLHFLTGVAASDVRLRGLAHYFNAAPADGDSVDFSLTQRVARALTADNNDGPIVVLHAEPLDARAQRDVALAAAAKLGWPALWISAQDLPADPGELATIARRIDREMVLSGALPVLSIDGATSELAGLGLIGRLKGSALWLGPTTAALSALPQMRRVLRIDLPAPNAAHTRASLRARWRRVAASTERDDETTYAALDRAAAQFHLTPAALDAVVERLATTSPTERRDAIWAAAREAARGGLDALAQRIVTRVDFDELALPKAHLAALRDITRQLRHRERVYREWGFGDKHARGQGLTALFAGESGTGKTLAAEAIANTAGLDLYRIDLATVVSKYIGETEKNLKRLFDAAETSGAVLLFDEADALFGKRSEVKDSHDRYANIEVAYLLQCIETYRGLAILTTNMRNALDRAFLRRIRFVVQFPFPDAAARERIWRLQFPPGAPLGEIDFAALARLQLTGGNIRSIAVNGAFKAADSSGRIDQAGLMEAARAEFAKLERPIGDALTRSTP